MNVQFSKQHCQKLDKIKENIQKHKIGIKMLSKYKVKNSMAQLIEISEKFQYSREVFFIIFNIKN